MSALQNWNWTYEKLQSERILDRLRAASAVRVKPGRTSRNNNLKTVGVKK